MSSRRVFLRSAAAAAAGLVVVRPSLQASLESFVQGAAQDAIWKQADQILARIVPPRFPTREFPVTRFGAVADGTTDCTEAIRKAIAACYSAGGGRVTIPAGRFATGAIHLKSRVNLHVSEGATLLFSRDARSYRPLVFTRFEGVELMNYSPFIYAFEQEDIAVTGSGTLDGQAGERSWWPWKGAWGGRVVREGQPTQAAARARLVDMAQHGVPVAQRTFGEGSYLRPNFIQPYRCKNVLIDGVRIVNSPMWEIHPVLCTNVTVRGVTVASHGPNNDGCDPESCRDVLIEKCTFDTGDDCIALKSGRNEDGRRTNAPIENVIVRDCVMRDGHGGVVIGSEVSGGARNIFAERCQMDSPRLDRALRIKSNSVRGGFVEHVYMRNVKVGQVAEAILTVDLFYEEGDSGKFPPTVRDIEVRDVTSGKSEYAVLLRGYGHTPLNDIRLLDCTFDNVAKPDVVEGVKGLRLANVRINGQMRNETIDR